MLFRSIVNELLSNSLKYAFPEGRAGEIRVEVRPEGERNVSLVVADNGIGLPENVGFWTTRSLGLRLVRTLADQLRATVELTSRGGTEIKLTFPAPGNEARL